MPKNLRIKRTSMTPAEKEQKDLRGPKYPQVRGSKPKLDHWFVILLSVERNRGVDPERPYVATSRGGRGTFEKARKFVSLSDAFDWMHTTDGRDMTHEIMRCEPGMSETEALWVRPIDPVWWGVTKWEPTAGRGQVVVPLPWGWNDELVDALNDNLNSQGVEECRQPFPPVPGESRRVLKFWTPNPHVSDRKLELAAKTIRRWRESQPSNGYVGSERWRWYALGQIPDEFREEEKQERNVMVSRAYRQAHRASGQPLLPPKVRT